MKLGTIGQCLFHAGSSEDGRTWTYKLREGMQLSKDIIERIRKEVRQGLDQPTSKKLIAAIKNAKLKVETQIQGEKLRVTGKKRDDLQAAIALLKQTDVELPLQYDNFRD